MNIVNSAVGHIEMAANRICIVTGCGMYRIRKVLELLLADSERSAVVVEASDKGPEKAVVSARRSAAPSSVVTVQGDGRSFADLVKAVKSTIDIDQEGIKVLAMRKKNDKAPTIRLSGDEKKAAVLLEVVNKAADISTSLKSQTDLIDIRDLDCGAVAGDIVLSLRTLFPCHKA